MGDFDSEWGVAYPRIRIYEIYIGNPEIYETLTTLFFGSGTKLLFTFLNLMFFDMRRERHSFFLS